MLLPPQSEMLAEMISLNSNNALANTSHFTMGVNSSSITGISTLADDDHSGGEREVHIAHTISGVVYLLMSLLGLVGNISLILYFRSRLSSCEEAEMCSAINVSVLALSDSLFSIFICYLAVGHFKGNPDFLGQISCKLVLPIFETFLSTLSHPHQ